MPKYRFSLVARARWEEQDIQEWVEYHRSIGFEHIYLYANDDEPDALFHAVAPWTFGPSPFLTFRFWPAVGDDLGMSLDFLRRYRHETEWFSFLDIDEFFVFRGLDNVERFMREYQDTADCLYFNWVIHGHNGKLRREPGFTLMNYPRRAAEVDKHTKMLCRASLIDPAAIETGYRLGRGAFFHFLDNYHLPGVRCVDVLHASTAGYAANWPHSADAFYRRPGYSEAVLARAYIAHFQFRSEADFLRRWRRGGHEQAELWKRVYESGEHKALLARNNAVYDSYLAAYWHRHTIGALRIHEAVPFGSPRFRNVALHKPSFQSSTCQPVGEAPKRSRVAGGGNNGLRTGTYGFHTMQEHQPWWCVDLLQPHRIGEVHVYNRADDPAAAGQAARLEVLGSLDTEQWVPLACRMSDEPFGLDGAPLVVKPAAGAVCRFVLLRLPRLAYLHLDEVEVYGEPVEP